MPRAKQKATPLPDVDPAATASLEGVGTTAPTAEEKKAATAAKRKATMAANKAAAEAASKAALKAVSAKKPEIEVDMGGTLVNVEPIAVVPVWEKVKCLSDPLLTVEAVNIAPFGKKTVMLRFIAGGELYGSVVMIPDIQYRAGPDKFC